jgi:hypothetical protein
MVAMLTMLSATLSLCESTDEVRLRAEHAAMGYARTLRPSVVSRVNCMSTRSSWDKLVRCTIAFGNDPPVIAFCEADGSNGGGCRAQENP